MGILMGLSLFLFFEVFTMIIKRTFYFCFLILTTLVVSACAQQEVRSQSPQLVASPDKVSLMLANAADRASVALEALAAVEQSRSPGIAVGPIVGAPPELKRAVTINWVGPVEPIAKTLADRAGYVFQPIGNPPPVPIVVSINVENQPVIDIFRSIGLQLGARADIKVDGGRKMVEVHYAPNTGIGG
jgi:defect-in-organelle-trafficking protein DotD